jgi:hypothetical protein
MGRRRHRKGSRPEKEKDYSLEKTKAMKIIVLLFVIFFGFGLLIQNTFSSPAKGHVEVRHEPPSANAAGAAPARVAAL